MGRTTAVALIGLSVIYVAVVRADYPVPRGGPVPDAFKRMRRPASAGWEAWWEANRDPYLEVIRQGMDQQADPDALERFREQATESLLAALKSDSFALRASAAVALGQIGAEKSIEPLTKVAKHDKDVRVRQAAILALGLLGGPDAERTLSRFAFAGLSSPRNRPLDRPNELQAALLSLNLLRDPSPEVVEGLRKVCRGMDPIASGMSSWSLTRPVDPTDPPVPRKLFRTHGLLAARELSEGSRLAASAISCWALSRRNDPADLELFQGLLTRTNVPWIANEAILALGSAGKGEPAMITALSEVALGTAKGRALPVYRMLDAQADHLAHLWKTRQSEVVREDYKRKGLRPRGSSPQRGIRAYIAAVKRVYGDGYFQLHYSGADYDATPCPKPWQRVLDQGPTIRDYTWLCQWHRQGAVQDTRRPPFIIYFGVEPVVMANIRSSAAVGLGRIDSLDSRTSLRQVLAEKEKDADEEHFASSDYSAMYKSMAIMSLGQMADVEAVPALAELVHPTSPHGVVVSKDRIESPLRGFAALALGLYSRPIRKSYETVDREGSDKICRLLAERLADRDELEDVRAACALALGLSGRTENLTYLQPASKTVEAEDDLLTGYMILARAMVGDKTILKPAGAYLSVQNNRTDRDGVLGRRAAVLGLGLTGSREAVATLRGCWNLGYHVAHEASVALSFCRGYDATEAYVGVMNSAEQTPENRALAARCLGELLMKERPSRLATRLVNGSNYEMRIPRLMYYRALANEFLFTGLLAPTAGEWTTMHPE